MTETIAAPPGREATTDGATPSHSSLWALALGSIGVVYGDIGTSPLYALREAVTAAAGSDGMATRAAVFGVNDGLVSNASLILGVAGATDHGGVIVLSGAAGLVAGAFSMAAGEYVSMSAQKELLEHEIEVERRELETSVRENSTWAGLMLNYNLYGWDPRRIAKRAERIELLTPARLQEVFRKYYPAERYTVVAPDLLGQRG